MRTYSTTALALGATLAATAFAATPAAALDRYADGTRISLSMERAGVTDATAQGVARAVAPTGTAASVRPASAAAPCPGGGGGVWLNGVSMNGFTLQGRSLQGKSLQGRSPTGAVVAAETGALRVTAVRLPDGRALAVRRR